jgi:hypothetical protein
MKTTTHKPLWLLTCLVVVLHRLWKSYVGTLTKKAEVEVKV